MAVGFNAKALNRHAFLHEGRDEFLGQSLAPSRVNSQTLALFGCGGIKNRAAVLSAMVQPTGG